MSVGQLLVANAIYFLLLYLQTPSDINGTDKVAKAIEEHLILYSTFQQARREKCMPDPVCKDTWVRKQTLDFTSDPTQKVYQFYINQKTAVFSLRRISLFFIL